MVVVPMRSHDGMTVGVLQLTNVVDEATGAIGAFPLSQEGVVTAFASQPAVAIDNVRLIHDNRRLVELLERANQELEQDNRRLRSKLDTQYTFSRVVGVSARMQQVFVLMEKVLDSNATACFKPYIAKEFNLCQFLHI